MTAAKTIIFGNTSFTRSSVPDILQDFAYLPKVDESVFEHKPDVRAIYLNNLEAYKLFVMDRNVTLRQIQKLTGVDPKQLYRLLQRMMKKAERSEERRVGKECRL